MAIYSTTAQQGIDVNAVFLLDPTNALEYPAPPFQPGELAWGTDGSEWVYCTASATLAAGNVCFVSQIPGSWSVIAAAGATITSIGVLPTTGSLTTVTTASPIGMLAGVVGGSTGTMVVPAPSGTQTGAFFWLQRAGNCPNISMNTTGGIMSTLHTTAAAGSLSSGSGGGAGTTVAVTGIVWSVAGASATGPNTGVLNYPYISATP